jgi:hypothetical protein
VSFFEVVVIILRLSSTVNYYSIAKFALALDTEEDGIGCFYERLEADTLTGGYCY